MVDPRDRHEAVDDVAQLVRMAGQRPAVPAEAARRAREAAHAAWKLEVARRSRRKRLWVGSALAAAAAAAFVIVNMITPPGGPGSSPTASIPVSLEAGAAQVIAGVGGSSPGSRSLQAGDSVEIGSVLATAPGERAAFALASGHLIRLDHGSRLRITGATKLELEEGAVYVDSGSESGAEGPGVDLSTRFGLVSEIGTQFEVRLSNGSASIRVREGRIVLRRDEESREAAVGTELLVDGEGSTRSREIPVHGETWAWVESITPMIDLESRSAREFLEWVAREQGWRLAYSGEQLAESAATITVAGDIRGMTILEALDAVLPSCRLAYTLDAEGGVLRIRPLE